MCWRVKQIKILKYYSVQLNLSNWGEQEVCLPIILLPMHNEAVHKNDFFKTPTLNIKIVVQFKL